MKNRLPMKKTGGDTEKSIHTQAAFFQRDGEKTEKTVPRLRAVTDLSGFFSKADDFFMPSGNKDRPPFLLSLTGNPDRNFYSDKKKIKKDLR